jgi:hypothetical protein
MTQYEKYLNTFYDSLDAVQQMIKRHDAIPATTRLVAAELQDVVYLIEDLVELTPVDEIGGVIAFTDTLKDEIRARVKKLLNPEVQ